MKKILLILTICLSVVFTSFSQKETATVVDGDSVRWALGGVQIKAKKSKYWKTYNPEQGYFQKAFTDKGDPRFMITNENQTFKFGIGGFVNVMAFADFNGLIGRNDFSTYMISVPTTYSQGQFYIGAEASRFNIKAVGETKHGPIVAFIETDFNNPDKRLRLRHAYISYFGFTVGQTYSTFMDLEAGPPTVDLEGPNNQISVRQPQIRYSRNFAKKWSMAIALEMNNAQVEDFPELKTYTEYQKFPDIPAYIKFKDKFGHIQLAGILRGLNYYDSLHLKSRMEIGYGVALSGKINLFKKTKLYFQGAYGEGIAHYIQDLSFEKFDLVFTKDLGIMQTLPMAGAYISVSQEWRKNIYSAIVYGYTNLIIKKDQIAVARDLNYSLDGIYDYAHYIAVNLFWDFIPYGTVGIEYLYGQRVNYPDLDNNRANGHANRVNLMIRYGF